MSRPHPEPVEHVCPFCGAGNHEPAQGDQLDCRRCDYPLRRPRGLLDRAIRDWQRCPLPRRVA